MRTTLFRIVRWGKWGAWAAFALSAQAQVPTDAYNYSRTSAFSYYVAADGAKAGLLKSETIEPGNAQSCVSTTYAYDAYGNKTSASTANCAGATGRAVFASRTSATAFAAQTVTVAGVSVTTVAGVFPTSSTNALTQSETKTYDPRFGAVLTLTGPNSLTTSWTVDDFGRKVREVRADGTRTVTAYCVLASSGLDMSANTSSANGDPVTCPTPAAGEAPADAVMFVHTEPRDSTGKNGPFVRVYSDRLGREIRSVTESFDGATQPAGRSGVTVAKDSVYNVYGAKTLETQPYFLVSTSSTTTGANDVGVMRTDYDVLGRPTAVYVADANGSQAGVTFGAYGAQQAARKTVAYSGLTTTTTNDKGQTRVEEKNANGELVRVTDANGAQLAHQRDAFGNLVATKDALQNTIALVYDIRGRKTQMKDPDTGTWNYDYNALGELVWQQSPNQLALATQTTLAYDLLGRMTSRVEPEYTSTWTYDKYADNSACAKGVGKLCESNTTNGVNRKLYYDSFGRPVSSRTNITGGPSFASAVAYDATTGRVISQTYPTGVQVGYLYTALGFLEKLVLNTTATVNPLPNSQGQTAASASLPVGSLLWRAQIVNAWGKMEQKAYSSGTSVVVGRATYEAATGRTTDLTAGSGSTVLNQHYTWDSLNNLTGRVDNNGDGSTGAVSETFVYGDSLNRLTSYTVSAPQIPGLSRTVNLQYNALGMLLYKSDVGNYTYPAQGATSVRPHALQSVAGGVSASYTYDANGNLKTATTGKYRTVSYTSFNLPDSQNGMQGAAGTPKYTWQYDENHARIKETHVDASGTRTTWYLHPDNQGGLGFESETAPSGAISNRHYLSAGGMAIGVLVSTGALPVLAAGQTSPTVLTNVTLVKVEYWHKDHLGSLIATTDHTGAVTQRYAYDPFGKRRYTNGSYDEFGNVVVDWSGTLNWGTDRGFTGHEGLDDVGLVNMNGRIFDPTLGVFLQGDPLVQDPANLQNYNRYGYCFNNPLTCTDPTGYFSLSKWFKASLKFSFLPTMKNAFNLIHASPGQQYVDQFIMNNQVAYAIGQIAAAYFGGPAGAAAYASYYAYERTGSMTAAYRAGLVAYISAEVFEAAGGIKADLHLGYVGGIAVHAVAGCVTSTIGGGKCGQGALSAAFAEAATPFTVEVTKGSDLAGTLVSAVVGGTGSVLGGGKFSNGAITGAFGYMFNELLHEGSSKEAMQRAGYAETSYPDGTYCNVQGGSGACGFPGATSERPINRNSDWSFDRSNCATAECAAGLLPAPQDNRTQSQIDLGQCKLTCNIAGMPLTISANTAARGGAPGTVLGYVIKQNVCTAICKP
jgi:RHS repeat-associated protein